MDIKIEGFLEEYRGFKQHASDRGISEDTAETLQLFAIFRKDERGREANGKKEGQPATERQKAYIRSIYMQNGVKSTEEEIAKLTKAQASEVINSFKGGAE